MASDSVVSSQQQVSSPSNALIFANSSNEQNTSGGNHVVDAKSDSGSEKISRNSSSGDEDWSGGKLVIDLDNDNDVEKSSKEMKPFVTSQSNNNDRETFVRNNNNNNSSNAESPGSSKHTLGADKGAKNASAAVSKAPSSCGHNSSTSHSSKTLKSKSKKSSKSSKQQPSSSSSNTSGRLPSPRCVSPAVTFNSSSDLTPISSKQIQGYDTKTSLARASNSPDEVFGKKSKSKSKSHHKKHGKHGEKSSNSHNSSSKSEFMGEKTKSKWKNSNTTQGGAADTNIATFTVSSGAHNLPAHISSSSPSLAIPNKNNSGHRRSASPSLMALSANNQQARIPMAAQHPARTAARSALATGNGAKTSHACNGRDSTLPDLNPAINPNHHSIGGHGQHSRKKQRKIQSSVPVSSTSSAAGHCDSESEQLYGHQAAGKREANKCQGFNVSASELLSGQKKLKLEADMEVEEVISGTGKQSTQHPIDLNHNPVHLRTDTGELRPSLPAPKPLVPGQTTVSPPVFAPSSYFVQNMPRYTASDAAAVSETTPHTSAVWSSGVHCGEEKVQSNPDLGPPIVNSHRSVGTVTSTSDIGVMTETDALGPCEPGTSVHLDGIVWHETDTGVLVVNVTWRNRTYVGTLLDATKHDWAPPRLSDSDLDMDLRGKNGRPKRVRGGANDNAMTSRKGRSRGNQSVGDDIKGSPSTAAKRRNKNSESEAGTVESDRASSKRARMATSRGSSQLIQSERNVWNGGSESSTCSSPVFIECPHPNCSKRYKHINGLKYHQAHAHLDFDEIDAKEGPDAKEEEETDHINSPPDGDADAKMSDLEVTPLDEGKKDSREVAVSTDVPEKAPVIGDETKLTPVASQSDPENVPLSQLSSSYSIVTPQREVRDPSFVAIPSYVTPSEPNVVTRTHDVISAGLPEAPRVTTPAPPTVSEASVADSESAMAVQTLLQLQDSENSSLPGLSTSYRRESPHPTLTLMSRGEKNPSAGSTSSTTQTHSTAPYRAPPMLSDHTRHSRSASDVTPRTSTRLGDDERQTSVVSQLPTSTPTHPPVSVGTNVAMVAPIPRLEYAGHIQHYGMHETPPPDKYIASLGNPLTQGPSGVKTAKGKMVPIPVDPNHGLAPGSTYAAAASPANLLGAVKKQKKKKKVEGQGGSFDGEQTRSDVVYPMKPEAPPQNESGPPMSSPFSVKPGAAPNSTPLPYQGPSKTQNIVLKHNTDHTTIITSNAVQVKTEPGLRLPPQNLGGRKVPGIVLHASSTQPQPTNNVTVKGTFHPHPDPHKPQTAVSAQAQDRLKVGQGTPTSQSSVKNKNNNNKLVGSQNPPRPAQDHPKPRTLLLQPNQSQPAMPAHHEQTPESSLQPRSRYPDPKPRPTGIINPHESVSMHKMQEAVESTIVSTYAPKQPRSKAPTPLPELPRQLDQSRRSPAVEARQLRQPAELREGRSRSRDESNDPPRTEAESRGESSIPTTKDPMEPPFPNPQMGFPQMQQLFGYQLSPYGYIPMDPAYSRTLLMDPRVRQSYEQYMQDVQKQQFLQQQSDKKVRKPDVPGKETSKPEQPPKIQSRSPVDSDKPPWPQQQHKRLSSPSPYPAMSSKDKSSSGIPPPHHPSPLGHPSAYKSSQVGTPVLTPVPSRNHLAVASRSSVPPSGSPHLRPETTDRGRPPVIDEVRPQVRKVASPAVRNERSPEKNKEQDGPGFKPSPASPGSLQYYPAGYAMYDPAHSTYRGVPQYVPGYSVLPYPPSGPTLYPAHWPPNSQAPAAGKQTSTPKPTKDETTTRPRSPVREDPPRVRPEVKGQGQVHYVTSKERMSREVPPMMTRKISRSPDPKAVVPISVPPRNQTPGAAPSVDHRAPSPPTQRHLHTHHHIHEGVQFLTPQHYAYPATAVIATGSDPATGFPAPFPPKRD
ncbi:uncharacterized protein LOC143448908 isoform X2 [Clavelina lepadiformis]|uniref:uncharacterized protein LOC143448908 isoform X2 n=1 Tax=Clavelina lepadiformis TaxID=159417 RepID=UPI0040427F6C